MRKLLLILIAAILMQACSALEALQPTLAPTSAPTLSPTAPNTPTVTLTPTRTITPTPRSTATLVISQFNTPVLLVDQLVITPAINSPTPIFPTGGFESVEISDGLIYYGFCKRYYTKFTVKVEHPEDVKKVYIFFRLESAKKPGDTTPWTGSVTDNDGGGYFRYTLRANQIPERRNFIKAWVHYQFVTEDADGIILGRTEVYMRNLVLEPCK